MKSKLLAVLALSAIGTGSAAADPCGPYLQRVFNDYDAARGYFYTATGTRVAARKYPFTSLAFSEGYRTSDGISTPAQVRSRSFYIGPVVTGGDVEGKFRQVFTDRNNGATDVGKLRLRRNGYVEIDGMVLGGLQCYTNPAQSTEFILTGSWYIPGYERSVWTFHVDRWWFG